MKHTIILFLLCANVSMAQQSFNAFIKDGTTNEPLIGASAFIENTFIGATADINGFLSIKDIPEGNQVIKFSFVGYESKSDTFLIQTNDTITIYLSKDNELDEVVVSATRSSRTIEEIPTRVEVIAEEELGEKAVMNSTNIAMVLRESTGIQIQQTSANSANQSLRIQGLDGRYTQLLKDGFPLFGGFSGGLSVMQIPPLDLQQVEVIKGGASTLYGGGAIAGLVNLVTKRPKLNEPELSIMFNQTSALGSTLNAFSSRRSEKIGYSIYGSAYRQIPYDPNNDDFSDIPKVNSLSLNPKLFYYINNKTTLWIGVNGTWENRLGGDLQVIDNKEDSIHTFSEQNISNRYSTQLQFERQIDDSRQLVIKNSINYFDRKIQIPDYEFQGEQLGSFTEATYSINSEKLDWIIGSNLFTDDFNEPNAVDSLKRDYAYTTVGGFIQNTWKANNKVSLETGLRADHSIEYGTFVLPKVSLLFKANQKLSGRIGGGFGYMLPTIFIEDAERLSYRNIDPIDQSSAEVETSVGGNFDLNYNTVIADRISFSINQLFFYTQLKNPLVLESNGQTNMLVNADGSIDSRGIETNMKFGYDDFKLFLQYAFVDARLNYNNIRNQKPLTPKHNAGAVLMYEVEEKWRIGYEVYYTGEQLLSDNSTTRDYWMMGFMVMREFEGISLFINFENFTDTRQSRYQDMVIPPHSDPTFTEIWAPTDGFVANGGFIINF